MTRSLRLPALRALALAALLAAGCATNPVSGRREFSLVSSGQEEQMGREGYKAVLAEYGAYDDTTVQAYVTSVGRRLASVSHLPGLDWHFTVLDDPTVNAFAMPGGYIYITRGILAHLNSEAQLAGVLGHEIGHVTARHTARQITRQQIAGLGLGVASVLSPAVARYGQVAQQGLGLLFLSYSRDNETEADQLGVAYATKGGWDPREIPATYHMLGRVSDAAGQRLPGYLSTHPDPGDREVRTREEAQVAAAGKTGLAVNATAYVEHLQGLVFGKDPRAGYFAGERYFNPGLKLEIALPPGWTYQDSRAALMAGFPGAEQGSLRAQMELSAVDAGTRGPSEYADDLARRGAVAGTSGGAESIGGHAAWVGRVAVRQQDGSTRWLVAGWVRWAPQTMLQTLGVSADPGGADEARIFASLRSLRDLTDPARLDVRPDRVRLEKVTVAAPFSALIPRFGPQALTLDQTSVLNNLDRDQAVPAGRLLKIVEPGRR